MAIYFTFDSYELCRWTPSKKRVIESRKGDIIQYHIRLKKSTLAMSSNFENQPRLSPAVSIGTVCMMRATDFCTSLSQRYIDDSLMMVDIVHLSPSAGCVTLFAVF